MRADHVCVRSLAAPILSPSPRSDSYLWNKPPTVNPNAQLAAPSLIRAHLDKGDWNNRYNSSLALPAPLRPLTLSPSLPLQ